MIHFVSGAWHKKLARASRKSEWLFFSFIIVHR